MSQYVKGPWRVDLNRYDDEYRVYTDNKVVGPCPVINSLFHAKGKKGREIATLISASPDLLESCKILVSRMTGGSMYPEYFKGYKNGDAGALEQAIKSIEKAEYHE